MAPYCLPASQAEAAKDVLTTLSQAATFAAVGRCLADSLVRLDVMALPPLEARFLRELFEDFADRQHGRVWPA